MCQTQELSLVEELSQKVNQMIGWDLQDDLIALMKELIEAKNELNLTANERRRIYQLGERVENRIVELIDKEVDSTTRGWNNGEVYPRNLKWQREAYKIWKVDAPTAKLKKTFREAFGKIQELLNCGSEREAERLLQSLEYYLSEAEDYAQEEANKESLGLLRSNLGGAKDNVYEITHTIHVWTVGVPRVAKKRQTTRDEMMHGFNSRIDNLDLRMKQVDEVLILRWQEEFEARQREAQKQRDLQAGKANADATEEAVKSLERRNELAGKAARQFLEHHKLGNAGGAKSCLDEIRRRDGGIPPALQFAHGELLRKTQQIRKI